tara:strand:+ start:63 stop:629 length:567 start_codon:yes stop_codon:yes gene_type:complete
MAMNDSQKARIAGRKQANASGKTNQMFYVQTRLAELKAAGKPVGPEVRKRLQAKFQSGDVARKGFAAPKKKTGGSSGSSDSAPKVTTSPGKVGTGTGTGYGKKSVFKPGANRTGTGTGTGYTSSTPKQVVVKPGATKTGTGTGTGYGRFKPGANRTGTGTGTGYTSSTPKQADKKKKPKTKYYPNTKK